MSLALLYIKTPAITIAVPIQLNNVTLFPKVNTESQINNALLVVLATLKKKLLLEMFEIRNKIPVSNRRDHI